MDALLLQVYVSQMFCEIVVNFLLHIKLLNHLSAYDCLSYSVQNQIRTFLGKKLSVEHHAEKGLVSDIKTLVLRGPNQKVI